MDPLRLLAAVACCLMFVGVTLIVAKYDRDRHDDIMILWILIGGLFWMVGFLSAVAA